MSYTQLGRSPKFLRAIAFILPHECEYARGHWGDLNFVVPENVSGDAGGVTKWGIDARSHPGVDIAGLDYKGALSIYDSEWRKRSLDFLPEKIAVCLFDVFVNGGSARQWLQIALNQICHAGLVVDGQMGPATLAAAHTCDEDAVVRYFIQERDERFNRIAKGHNAKFLEGWLDRDRDLKKFLGV
jgi:lysozyme family protein